MLHVHFSRMPTILPYCLFFLDPGGILFNVFFIFKVHEKYPRINVLYNITTYQNSIFKIIRP